MSRRRSASVLAVCLAALSACSGASGDAGPATTAAPVTASSTTIVTTTSTTTAPTSTEPEPTSTDAAGESTVPGETPTSTDPTATTEVPETTTTVPGLDVADPACVVEVAPGESLSLITGRIPDEIVTPETVRDENGLTGDTIHPGQLLDVCVGNGIDDITGEERVAPNAAVDAINNQANVIKQQERLNELFAPYAIAPLTVDGISGPVTRQRLCAFRLAMGFPATTEDMPAGSDEEVWLMGMTFLPVPKNSAMTSDRWALIDRTCQIMFVGAGPDQIVFVFPTSTGNAEFPTRLQDRSRAFRYDPASNNGGWHDSTTYPADADNPLNGNMYKPIYFDRGQAIHGALNVPRSPASHGCARLRVADQDQLVSWLGLGDAKSPIGSTSRIGLTVNVQGDYVWR